MVKKTNYKQDYLNDFIGVTGITDLTLQDVYGALIHLTERGIIPVCGPSLWSKAQFDCLWRNMMDGDAFRKNVMQDFKDAVEETRWRRKHREKPEPPEELTFPDEENPEEDMERVSDMLLRQDDVYY